MILDICDGNLENIFKRTSTQADAGFYQYFDL